MNNALLRLRPHRRAARPLMGVAVAASLFVATTFAPGPASGQQPPSGQQPSADPPSEPPPQLPPPSDPLSDPPAPSSPASPASPPGAPPSDAPPTFEPRATPIRLPSEEEELPRPMSEGRAIVSAWNTGFQWGIAPGVVFADGKTGFFLGIRLGYGFDTGSVIVVPGVRLAGYFTDPNVYVGMPVLKLVYPIDRFAPFIEGGAGVGHVEGVGPIAGVTGAGLMGGGGFMFHFTPRFALGVEANYQVVTGTSFGAFGVGPIIAIAF